VRTYEDVEVQNTLNGGWSSGFEVIDSEESPSGVEMLRLRRRSDGCILPANVSVDRVRPARARASR